MKIQLYPVIKPANTACTEPRQSTPGQVVGLAAFSSSFLAQAGSGKAALPRLVHQRVTLTVRRLENKIEGAIKTRFYPIFRAEPLKSALYAVQGSAARDYHKEANSWLT